jgi:hypothetical protein
LCLAKADSLASDHYNLRRSLSRWFSFRTHDLWLSKSGESFGARDKISTNFFPWALDIALEPIRAKAKREMREGRIKPEQQ